MLEHIKLDNLAFHDEVAPAIRFNAGHRYIASLVCCNIISRCLGFVNAA